MTGSPTSTSEDRIAVLRELDLVSNGRFADLDKLVMLALDICSGNLAAFTVHDGDTAHEVSSSFEAPCSMPREECMCWAPLELGATMQVADAAADQRFARARYVVGSPSVRSFIGVPVGAESGCPVGVLAVGHSAPGRFGAQEVARLEKSRNSSPLSCRSAGLRTGPCMPRQGQKRNVHGRASSISCSTP